MDSEDESKEKKTTENSKKQEKHPTTPKPTQNPVGSLQ